MKFDFDDYAFIYSVRIKFKDDSEAFREYNLNQFPQGAEETKDLYKLINELTTFFGNRIKRKRVYVYE